MYLQSVSSADWSVTAPGVAGCEGGGDGEGGREKGGGHQTCCSHAGHTETVKTARHVTDCV